MRGPFYATPVAKAIPFDPVFDVIPETNVQDAIESAARFGSYFTYAESNTTSSTTSTTVWSVKVTLTPSVSLPLGTYLLKYAVIGTTAAANREIDVRVRQGTSTLFQIRESIIRTQGERQIAGQLNLAGLSGTPTFTLEFKVGDTATTASVRQANLALWRVA